MHLDAQVSRGAAYKGVAWHRLRALNHLGGAVLQWCEHAALSCRRATKIPETVPLQVHVIVEGYHGKKLCTLSPLGAR